MLAPEGPLFKVCRMGTQGSRLVSSRSHVWCGLTKPTVLELPLFFIQQSLQRPKCPSNYALGISSPSHAELRSHCLETEYQRWKKSRSWLVAPQSPQGAAPLLHQGTFAEHGESSPLQEEVTHPSWGPRRGSSLHPPCRSF